MKTRYRSLIKLKVPRDKAWEWANTRKGYWRISKSFILHCAITKEALQEAGLLNMEAFYKKMHDGITQLIEPPYTRSVFTVV
ncbi:hypothetical protein ACFPU1_13285 [Thalassorhabdus alkalitolerans]|uniref:Uncharacterized protein n=1 Tax=Thalassorhabdus alkalitolerans TaxID=2282697 RepID=A0ABW0YQX1_9BACI